MTREEKIQKERERLYNQYLYEKSLYEYGSRSMLTFKEWLDIKNIKLCQEMKKYYDKR